MVDYNQSLTIYVNSKVNKFYFHFFEDFTSAPLLPSGFLSGSNGNNSSIYHGLALKNSIISNISGLQQPRLLKNTMFLQYEKTHTTETF